MSTALHAQLQVLVAHVTKASALALQESNKNFTAYEHALTHAPEAEQQYLSNFSHYYAGASTAYDQVLEELATLVKNYKPTAHLEVS